MHCSHTTPAEVLDRVSAVQAISSVDVDPRTLPQYFAHGELGLTKRAAASGADTSAVVTRRGVVMRIAAELFLGYQSLGRWREDVRWSGAAPLSSRGSGSAVAVFWLKMRGRSTAASGVVYCRTDFLYDIPMPDEFAEMQRGGVADEAEVLVGYKEGRSKPHQLPRAKRAFLHVFEAVCLLVADANDTNRPTGVTVMGKSARRGQQRCRNVPSAAPGANCNLLNQSQPVSGGGRGSPTDAMV